MKRGSSLLELLAASALLLAAMTGLLQLMLHGSRNSRDGVEQINASLYAQQVMSELQALQQAALVPGNGQDGGVFKDISGRRYGVVVDIIDDTFTLGGYPTYTARVRVEYSRNPITNGFKTMEFRTIISRNPDAG